MREIVPALRNAPLFSGIRDEEIGAMLQCLQASEAKYARAVSILRSGEVVESVGLLLEGAVLVVQEDFWGNRNLIARIQPGQLFGESYACSGAPLGVDVVADSPSRVLWLNVHRVLSVCPNGCAYHSRLIRNLLSVLAEKNLRFKEKLDHMGQRTTREKLLSYLSAEARRQKSSEFDITFNRQQLADYLSVERSAMSAELGKLREEGVLDFERSHFRLEPGAQLGR